MGNYLWYLADLAEFGRNLVSTHKGITARFGKNFKVRRQWIDIDFPPIAPPEFERSGYVTSTRVNVVIAHYS